MDSHSMGLRSGLAAWLCAAFVAGAPVELLPEGGFEGPLSDTGLPVGAGTFMAKDATIKATIVPGGRTGKALLIEGEGAHAGVGLNRVPIQPGQQIALRGWVKVEGTEGTRAIVKFDYTRDGTFLGQTVSPPISGMEWQEQTIRSEVERFPDATRIAAAAVIEGDAEAWLDDLVLTLE